ncbi:MAG: LUD domain-containing protein, partial [Oscillospiraceae bacterium]|nr:LUD domain-containing protein [Oscillospiraceae bacterium]
MDFTNLKKTLERLGYAVSCFAAGADAAAYLNEQIDGKTVGFGGSVTLRELGLFDSLS